MRKVLMAACLGVATMFAAAPALAAQVYSGEVLAGRVTTAINSGSAYVGETVTAGNVAAGNGSFTGGTLYGHVTNVQHAGLGRPGKLQIVFTQLRLPNGSTYAVDGVVTALNTQTKNNTGREVIGAVGGMIAGNILGKTIFHSGAGGLLGAAGGFLIAHNDRQNINVPAGSAVRVSLRSARVQSRR